MSDGTLANLFASLADKELVGGCDCCSAVQRLSEDVAMPGVWHLIIHHDDDCPVLRAHKAVTN